MIIFSFQKSSTEEEESEGSDLNEVGVRMLMIRTSCIRRKSVVE